MEQVASPQGYVHSDSREKRQEENEKEGENKEDGIAEDTVGGYFLFTGKVRLYVHLHNYLPALERSGTSPLASALLSLAFWQISSLWAA